MSSANGVSNHVVRERSEQSFPPRTNGYFTSPTQTKEDAQRALIQLLLDKANIPQHENSSSLPLKVLDTGCGVGGTSRYLAREHGFEITGITLSSEQVKMAYQLSRQEEGTTTSSSLSSTTTDKSVGTTQDDDNDTNPSVDVVTFPSGGSVRFIQMDAETMGERFQPEQFDIVWICEALSHFPDKPLFFRNAATLLKPGHGKLVMADWFRAIEVEDDSDAFINEIQPIEEGMLLPPLCTMSDYTEMAEQAGLNVCTTTDGDGDSADNDSANDNDGQSSNQGRGWKDISKEVAKTWDISLQLVASPSLWAFAFSQGRDFVAFLRAFQAMRKGFSTGNFRYGVAAFQKA